MKKIKVLALIMVFALTALGGAYAMWYDNLFINETVSTGIVDLKWGNTISSDPGANYQGHGGDVFAGSLDRLDPCNPNEAKNVASKNVVLNNDTEALPPIIGVDNRNQDDIMTITLNNGYPGYQAYVASSIKNVGTVPTKLSFSLTNGTVIPDWMHFQIVNAENGIVLFDNKGAQGTAGTASVAGEVGTQGWGWPGYPGYPGCPGCPPDDPDPENPPVSTFEGIQIDPGQSINVKIVERILQSAPQNANACFNMQIKGIQWNEYSANGAYALPNQITTPY